MKRKAIFVAIVALAGFAAGGIFAVRNFRGALPAFEPAPRDIGELIDTATSTPGTPGPVNATDMPLKLPPGFSISVFARGLGNPRVLLHGPTGELLVSVPSAGKVVSLRDMDGDGKAETIETLLEGLNRPHGITTRCTGEPNDKLPLGACTLYVAETDAVMAYAYTPDARSLADTSGKKLLDLPAGGGGHFTRTLMFRPYPNDAELLVSIGSSCNVCIEQDDRRATVQAVNVETGKSRLFAKGLRNTVFMATHPVTGDAWGTEMGRDSLGDDIPPDEINIIRGSGQNSAPPNFGWPICYGKNVHDTVFDTNTYIRNPCMEPFETPSYIDLQAHSAPLGLSFVPEEGWPEDWWYDLIVAYHGSWNRSEPTGYKLVRMKLDAQGNYAGVEDFVTGWLRRPGEPGVGAPTEASEFATEYEVLGRPVDILIEPGGTMYVSDDKAGIVYRIRFTPS